MDQQTYRRVAATALRRMQGGDCMTSTTLQVAGQCTRMMAQRALKFLRDEGLAYIVRWEPAVPGNGNWMGVHVAGRGRSAPKPRLLDEDARRRHCESEARRKRQSVKSVASILDPHEPVRTIVAADPAAAFLYGWDERANT